MFFRTVLISSVLALVGMAGSASAAETTATMKATSSVVPSCTLKRVRDVFFNAYDPVGVNATTKYMTRGAGETGYYEIRCNKQASAIRMGADQGLHATAGSTCEAPLRNMASCFLTASTMPPTTMAPTCWAVVPTICEPSTLLTVSTLRCWLSASLIRVTPQSRESMKIRSLRWLSSDFGLVRFLLKKASLRRPFS